MKAKALLLLIVFLLNTVVGFACAIKNNLHEDSGENTAGERDHHQPHHLSFEDYHVKSFVIANNNGVSIQGGDETCCQNSSNQFNSLTKETPRNCKVLFKAHELAIFYRYISISQAYNRFLFPVLNALKVCQWPPSTNTRIAIQSFQI